jgi:hypothetical protein
MTRLATTQAMLGILVGGMLAAGLAADCGSNQVAVGSQGIDAAAGRGGAVAGGSGGSATGGGVGAGGVTPSGGTTVVGSGGSVETGGSKSSGGTTARGGSKAGGGAVGTGGATGTGGTAGSTGRTCGGLAGVTCATNEFCDLLAGSCNLSDATGTCVLSVGVGCIASVQPVCGCNGKTYNNDCERQVAGVSKKSDGACPTDDAGATTCGQVTTLAECDSRSDCHSVFMDIGACDCSAVGCCEQFTRCADGRHANCTPPVAFGCTISQPGCGGAYVTSYTSNCYEGCSRQSECAVAVDTGVIMTPTLPAACQADGDCCVAVDACTAVAYLVGRNEYPAMVASIPSISSGRETCVHCIPPSVQVQCKDGFCAGEKLPIYSGEFTTSHCGYISVSDAGTSTGSAHSAVDAGTAARPSTWSCSSP